MQRKNFGLILTDREHTRIYRFLARAFLYVSVIFVGLPIAFCHVMTRTHRSSISSQPPDGYETVELTSEELLLRAWLSKGELDRAAVVIVHGLGDTLESYRMHAKPLIVRGHTVMLLDLRGHGASQGTYTTLGGRESEDVRSAMRYLREAGLANNGLVLWGHSMGAVAVLLAAADQTDVRAVIAEAPYDSYRNTVAHHAQLLYGLPSWMPIIQLSIKAAELRAGFDADAIDTVAVAPHIDAPILGIVDGDDLRMPESVVRRITERHSGPSQIWVAEGVKHVGAIMHPQWEETVLGFLDEQGI